MFGLPFKVSGAKVCPGALYGSEARVVSALDIDVQHPLNACPPATYTVLDTYAPQDAEPCQGSPGAFEVLHLFTLPNGLVSGNCYNAELTLTDFTKHGGAQVWPVSNVCDVCAVMMQLDALCLLREYIVTIAAVAFIAEQ
jgi:hypothetical protein